MKESITLTELNAIFDEIEKNYKSERHLGEKYNFWETIKNTNEKMIILTEIKNKILSKFKE